MWLFSLLKKAYLKIGMNTAAPGTILFNLHVLIRSLVVWMKPLYSYAANTTSPSAEETELIEIRAEFGRTVSSVCILKLDHIGDFIIALPAMRLLRASFPNAAFTLVCLPGMRQFAESYGLFQKVVEWPAIAASQSLSKYQTYKPLTIVEQQNFRNGLDDRYDLAIDLRHDADTRFYLDYIDSDVRSGFAGNTRSSLQIMLPRMEWSGSRSSPPNASTRLTLLAQATVDYFENWRRRRKAPPASPRVGIALGAGSKVREWPVDLWIKLISMLIAAGEYEIVLLGSSYDCKKAEFILENLEPSQRNEIKNYVGKIDLLGVKQELSKLSVLICLDSGVGHIAGELGLPLVSIFAGAANVDVWKPRADVYRLIRVQMKCAPCHIRDLADCKNGHRCMTSITPEIVFQSLVDVLRCETKGA